MKCPKCGYERRPTDHAPDWQCPSCKVAYVKVSQAQNPVPKSKLIPSVQPDTEQDENDLHEKLSLAAKGQKIVIYTILLNFLLRAVERSYALPGVVLDVLFVCVAVYALIGIVKICSGLDKTQNQKILFMVLSFFPLINLMTLVYLSVKTSRVLRAAGWKVGLLGAKS